MPTLALKNDERGILVGQTGTGKTTLAKALLQKKQPIVIIDPKGDFDRPSYMGRMPIITKPDDIRNNGRSYHYIPHPDYCESQHWNDVFRSIYWNGESFVYIDELSVCTKSALSYPPYLRALYQQGRTRGIGILAATQRPSGVPLFAFSESQAFYVFRLMLSNDLKRVREWIGEDCTIHPSNPHSFYFRRYDMNNAKLCMLAK
jgi:ABC-type dipeptide/oligopeptide/nickel transport system ATPase component